MVDEQNESAAAAPAESLVTYTHIVYGLHALAALIGLTSAATVVGNFFFGVPSIVAVIMNYARRSAVQGTYLESHFRWQIRTFWYGMLVALIVWAVSLPLILLFGLGLLILPLGLTLIGVWLVYRVLRGWLALRDHRPMYV